MRQATGMGASGRGGRACARRGGCGTGALAASIPRVLRVLLRDERVLVLDKPPGLLSVPGRGETGPSARSLVEELAPSALPVHRLDRDTSGVLLFALDREAHRALNQAFESRRAVKTYLALVRGDLPGPVECDLPLAEGRKGGMRVAAAGEESQPAQTGFEPLERFGAATWVGCRPKTGRTHQLRVHLAALGHPLLVDPRYGDEGPVRAEALCAGAGEAIVLSRTPLHAAALRVPHPAGGWLEVESPLPADLSACLSLLRRARRGA